MPGRRQMEGGVFQSAQESANHGDATALTGRALADEAAEGVLARAEGLPALAARPAAVAVAGAVVLLQLALQAHLPRRPTGNCLNPTPAAPSKLPSTPLSCPRTCLAPGQASCASGLQHMPQMHLCGAYAPPGTHAAQQEGLPSGGPEEIRQMSICYDIESIYPGNFIFNDSRHSYIAVVMIVNTIINQ